MRKVVHSPSIVQDLGALAGLYRTVFWMIGRKAQYGQIWPEPLQDTTAKAGLHTTASNGTEEAKELVGSRH